GLKKRRKRCLKRINCIFIEQNAHIFIHLGFSKKSDVMKKLLCILALVLFANATYAQFTTPGTGVVWSLNDFLTNAPEGVISLSDGIYTISENITIATTDELLIADDATIAIDPNIQLTIDGTFRITADAVTITASDPEAPYETIRFSEGSTGLLTNATIDYGTGIRVSTGDFE